MIDIREHGGVLSGQKKQVQFVPQPFTPVSINNQYFNSDSKMEIGKTVALIKTARNEQATVDLTTNKLIAKNGLTCYHVMMDENDDYIYGRFYDVSTYFYCCYDKNFNMVWKNPDSSLASSGILTKDYIITSKGGVIIKLSRATGEIVQTINNSDITFGGAMLWGSNETGTKIIQYQSNGKIVIINVSDLSIDKVIQTDIGTGTSLSLYGVALYKNILHVFRAYTSTLRHYMFDINGTNFTLAEAITTGGYSGDLCQISWGEGYGYNGYVKTLKKGVLVHAYNTMMLLSYKLGDGGVNKLHLAGKKVRYAMANNIHYFNFDNTSGSYAVTDYGLLR
ncbi:hypothetical protein [Bacillus badius]|uniref:Phage protein n=1 Tax=Bacillus badius TaxID=1455 RepID=A0ABR5ANQ5_BACBA|nr:hypothetical protein [Bacillus badius]KIL72511.1 hypothetical protein SD77_3484 [Bacillus badius]MED4718290.1 hypothetical protein [Bacillus badius]